MVHVKLLTVRKSTSSGSEFHTLTIRSEKKWYLTLTLELFLYSLYLWPLVLKCGAHSKKFSDFMSTCPNNIQTIWSLCGCHCQLLPLLSLFHIFGAFPLPPLKLPTNPIKEVSGNVLNFQSFLYYRYYTLVKKWLTGPNWKWLSGSCTLK